MTVEEVSGRTVDDAVDRALARLGVSRGHVDVEVIREGRRGLFGLGGEDAIVRVTTRPGAPGHGGAAAPARREAGDREGRPRRRRRGGRGGERAERGEHAERERAEHAERERAERGEGERAGGRERRERPRDGGGRGGAAPERRGPAVAEPTRVPGAPDEPPLAPPDGAEDEIDFAGRTLRDLLTLLGLEDTEIEARAAETPGDGEGRVAQVFDISGVTEDASDELGLLIGRRGETLGSLQYLLNVMVGRAHGDQDLLFAVDIEGYRRRREESLVEMARRVADEVRETGDVITLEPMPPAERRIIHLALGEEPGVATESVGSGDHRQVEVMPDPGEDEAGENEADGDGADGDGGAPPDDGPPDG